MPRIRSNFCHLRRGGFTLLELTVVLVILALVATVAIQSLQPQVDNQRFQSATRLLDEIRNATIGPSTKYQSDGTPLISGYVADVGQLPTDNLQQQQAMTSDEPPVLMDLWDNQSELANNYPFQFRSGPVQPTDYSSISLPCGWRGPYLQLPTGETSLKDPWGRSPLVIAGAEGQVARVEILVPSQDEIEDQTLGIDLINGKVQVTGKLVSDNEENTSITVVMLVPAPQTSLTTLVVLDDEDPDPGSFLFSNVPIGMRAIVVDVNSKRHVRYIQVPNTGLNYVFNCRSGDN